MRVVVITLDRHLAGAVDRAALALAKDIPGITLSLHAAAEWAASPAGLQAAKEDVAAADIVIASMLFMEDHIQAIFADLEARRDACDAMVCIMSAPEVVKLTRIGRFSMDAPQSGAMALLKRLRGERKPGQNAGRNQMAMLRRLPKILRYIPGTAQDVRVYFLTMQYWLACSDGNLANMVRLLIDRYAAGPRQALSGSLKVGDPVVYPDTGLYHPDLPDPGAVTEDPAALPRKEGAPTVGLLLMRSYILAGDTGHYDGVIRALTAKGLNVVPAFAAGLDARPAIETFFVQNGTPTIDAVVSLTGFSLVGGPAFNDSSAAADTLAALDVPCISAQALEFQTIEEWRQSEHGLLPVEATMMLAVPELDGATAPIVFGGRSSGANSPVMSCDPERVARLVARIDAWIGLRKTPAADRRLAIVLFNFPPNGGATGTAAHLSVFESLWNTLIALKADGYKVEVPETVDGLRDAILHGNAGRYGTDANVLARIDASDHVASEPHLEEIEAQWGPAPGRDLTDGRNLFVQGVSFGKVMIGIQPSFGYEGDPMRMLFERGFAPTHAFSAFYRYLREDFAAHAILHFGTHGALEFMPGKQTGLSDACWPDRLIGAVPNIYLYAANNPSEGTIAKRRSGATLVSYLTPPIQKAALYKDLIDVKSSLERWRALPPERTDELRTLKALIVEQAANLDLLPENHDPATVDIPHLLTQLTEFEQTLIPYGLHVVGAAPSPEERRQFLHAINEGAEEARLLDPTVDALANGEPLKKVAKTYGLQPGSSALANAEALERTATFLEQDSEIDGLIRALNGRFIRPVAGGDLIRSPEILPTGRNLHGFDPFRLPSAFAVADGRVQADRLLARHQQDGNGMPSSIAMVLWGTDNLKTEGGPIGQALALIGAAPRFDSFGRLAGAKLIPLETLGRPRIDVTMTLSGIFRDLLPLQTKLLAEAAFLAADADEPLHWNFVRKHALDYQEKHGCDLETAALRVFGNDNGAYGANVNLMIDNGAWEEEDDLGDVFVRRKGFAYGLDGHPKRHDALLQDVLGNVDLAYQNLESVEVGVTTIDHYFDSLGGVARAVSSAAGKTVPVYIGDQTHSVGKVRTLDEQVALESRTRMLNPAWYEGMLKHGYEGVQQIDAHLKNTVGWSATTGQVSPWVYKRITETFVLDEEMRERMAALNPKASARVANRLLEAHERNYWTPEEETLEALRAAGDELEDRLEGITAGAAA